MAPPRHPWIVNPGRSPRGSGRNAQACGLGLSLRSDSKPTKPSAIKATLAGSGTVLRTMK